MSIGHTASLFAIRTIFTTPEHLLPTTRNMGVFRHKRSKTADSDARGTLSFKQRHAFSYGENLRGRCRLPSSTARIPKMHTHPLEANTLCSHYSVSCSPRKQHCSLWLRWWRCESTGCSVSLFSVNFTRPFDESKLSPRVFDFLRSMSPSCR